MSLKNKIGNEGPVPRNITSWARIDTQLQAIIWAAFREDEIYVLKTSVFGLSERLEIPFEKSANRLSGAHQFDPEYRAVSVASMRIGSWLKTIVKSQLPFISRQKVS